MPNVRYEYTAVHHLRVQFEQDAPCEFDSKLELRMTNRKDFDYSLIKHYQEDAGGELINDSFASFEVQADRRILVTMKSGRQLMCRYLVGADGAHSHVRRQLVGAAQVEALFMEEYVEQQPPNEIFVHFSNKYAPGCFYKFPGVRRDIYGFRAPETNRESFGNILTEFGIPHTRFLGAYIPFDTVSSPVANVILIGDAGGFANKLTGEGLYDCFKTAYNAKVAIVEGKPFDETNRQVFRKMKNEQRVFDYFFSPLGFRLFRKLLRYPRFCKFCFDAKMQHEGFLR